MFHQRQLQSPDPNLGSQSTVCYCSHCFLYLFFKSGIIGHPLTSFGPCLHKPIQVWACAEEQQATTTKQHEQDPRTPTSSHLYPNIIFTPPTNPTCNQHQPHPSPTECHTQLTQTRRTTINPTHTHQPLDEHRHLSQLVLTKLSHKFLANNCSIFVFESR